MGPSIVDEALEEVLSDHPDLHHAVKAQVIQVIHDGNITNFCG